MGAWRCLLLISAGWTIASIVTAVLFSKIISIVPPEGPAITIDAGDQVGRIDASVRSRPDMIRTTRHPERRQQPLRLHDIVIDSSVHNLLDNSEELSIPPA